MASLCVKDLMTKGAVSIKPGDSILKAAQLLYSRNYHGLPVVDDENRVVGILTEHDFISKSANIHLPTFIKLLESIDFNEHDKMIISKEIKEISSLKVKDIMNSEPLLIDGDADVFELAKTFTEHHGVNPIPVVDKERRLLGVASRYDIIKLYIGASPVRTASGGSSPRGISVDKFLSDFKREFTTVSRFRSRFWLLLSFFFVLLGFFLAVLLFFRIGGK